MKVLICTYLEIVRFVKILTMKKLLLILLCLPNIGFASFPIITDTKESEIILVPIDNDFNQNTVDKKIKKGIWWAFGFMSPFDKDGNWRLFGWLRLILLSFFLLFVIALALADLN